MKAATAVGRSPEGHVPSLLPYSLGDTSQPWFGMGKVCPRLDAGRRVSLGAVLEGGCGRVPPKRSSYLHS